MDYFLYDNRTWAPRIGRDWGIKAATGILASRSDLQSAFDRYCGALPSEHGYLSGFGQALGGVRPPDGDGYLLCITVETTDPFGRPSWAIYGLWCPDHSALENVLAADPIGAVQSIVGADPPPPAIALSSPAPALLPVPRQHRETTTFRLFDGPSSITETISVLLGAIRRSTPLPNVLGITASSRLPEIGRQFDVVHCHPLSDRSELALEQCRSDEPFAIVEPEIIVPTPPPPARSQTAIFWMTASLAVAAVIVIAFRWPFPGRSVESSAEITLREIQLRLDPIIALDPEELRNIAKKDERKEVLQAYDALIEERERIAGPVAGYYEEQQVRSLDAAGRLQKIRLILDERTPGDDACRVIGTGNPTVRHWCNSLANLERAAYKDFSRRTSS